MKTTMELPDSLFRETKALAAHKGLSLRQVVVDMQSRATPEVALATVAFLFLWPGNISRALTRRSYEEPCRRAETAERAQGRIPATKNRTTTDGTDK